MSFMLLPYIFLLFLGGITTLFFCDFLYLCSSCECINCNTESCSCLTKNNENWIIGSLLMALVVTGCLLIQAYNRSGDLSKTIEILEKNLHAVDIEKSSDKNNTISTFMEDKSTNISPNLLETKSSSVHPTDFDIRPNIEDLDSYVHKKLDAYTGEKDLVEVIEDSISEYLNFIHSNYTNYISNFKKNGMSPNIADLHVHIWERSAKLGTSINEGCSEYTQKVFAIYNKMITEFYKNGGGRSDCLSIISEVPFMDNYLILVSFSGWLLLFIIFSILVYFLKKKLRIYFST